MDLSIVNPPQTTSTSFLSRAHTLNIVILNPMLEFRRGGIEIAIKLLSTLSTRAYVLCFSFLLL
jgi:hypothetical protein